MRAVTTRETVRTRGEIRQAILSGDILAALRLLEDHYPAVLKDRPGSVAYARGRRK